MEENKTTKINVKIEEQEKMKENLTRELEQFKNYQPPTEEEIAKSMRMTVEEYRKYLADHAKAYEERVNPNQAFEDFNGFADDTVSRYHGK